MEYNTPAFVTYFIDKVYTVYYLKSKACPGKMLVAFEIKLVKLDTKGPLDFVS